MKRFISFVITAILLISFIPAGTITSFAAETGENQIIVSDAFLQLTVNTENGRFSARTTGGDPNRAADGDKPILYEFDGKDPETSYASFRIGSDEVIFGNVYGRNGVDSGFVQSPTLDGNVITAIWRYKDVYITQTITLVEQYSNTAIDEGNSTISYSIENKGASDIRIGTRILLDTMAGGNDGCLIRGSLDTEDMTGERFLSGSDVPQHWFSSDDESDIGLVAYGMLYGWGETAPSRVIFGHWSGLSSTRWDYDVDGWCRYDWGNNKYGSSDSAVAVYWDPQTVAPGGSVSHTTTVGMGVRKSPGDGQSFTATVSAPKKVLRGADGKSTFSISVELDNTYESCVDITDNIEVEISIPENAWIVNEGETPQKQYIMGGIKKGQKFVVTWNLAAQSDTGMEGWVFDFEVMTKTKIIVSDSGRKTDSTTRQKAYVLQMDDFSNNIPDVQFQRVSPAIVYAYDKNMTMMLHGSNLFYLADASKAKRLYITHESGKYEADLKSISVQDDKTVLINLPGSLPAGKWELVIEHEYTSARGLFFTVTEDVAYQRRGYGTLLFTKTSEWKRDSDYYKQDTDIEIDSVHIARFRGNTAPVVPAGHTEVMRITGDIALIDGVEGELSAVYSVLPDQDEPIYFADKLIKLEGVRGEDGSLLTELIISSENANVKDSRGFVVGTRTEVYAKNSGPCKMYLNPNPSMPSGNPMADMVKITDQTLIWTQPFNLVLNDMKIYNPRSYGLSEDVSAFLAGLNLAVKEINIRYIKQNGIDQYVADFNGVLDIMSFMEEMYNAVGLPAVQYANKVGFASIRVDQLRVYRDGGVALRVDAAIGIPSFNLGTNTGQQKGYGVEKETTYDILFDQNAMGKGHLIIDTINQVYEINFEAKMSGFVGTNISTGESSKNDSWFLKGTIGIFQFNVLGIPWLMVDELSFDLKGWGAGIPLNPLPFNLTSINGGVKGLHTIRDTIASGGNPMAGISFRFGISDNFSTPVKGARMINLKNVGLYIGTDKIQAEGTISIYNIISFNGKAALLIYPESGFSADVTVNLYDAIYAQGGLKVSWDWQKQKFFAGGIVKGWIQFPEFIPILCFQRLGEAEGQINTEFVSAYARCGLFGIDPVYVGVRYDWGQVGPSFIHPGGADGFNEVESAPDALLVVNDLDGDGNPVRISYGSNTFAVPVRLSDATPQLTYSVAPNGADSGGSAQPADIPEGAAEAGMPEDPGKPDEPGEPGDQNESGDPGDQNEPGELDEPDEPDEQNEPGEPVEQNEPDDDSAIITDYSVRPASLNEIIENLSTADILLSSESTYAPGAEDTVINAKPPVIGSQPRSATVTAGTTHILSVEAQSPDGGALTYQWYSNTLAASQGGAPIPGATGAALATRTSLTMNNYYYAEITNTIDDNGDGGAKTATVTSDFAVLLVDAAGDEADKVKMKSTAAVFSALTPGTEATISSAGTGNILIAGMFTGSTPNVTITKPDNTDYALRFNGAYPNAQIVEVTDNYGNQLYTLMIGINEGDNMAGTWKVTTDKELADFAVAGVLSTPVLKSITVSEIPGGYMRADMAVSSKKGNNTLTVTLEGTGKTDGVFMLVVDETDIVDDGTDQLVATFEMPKDAPGGRYKVTAVITTYNGSGEVIMTNAIESDLFDYVNPNAIPAPENVEITVLGSRAVVNWDAIPKDKLPEGKLTGYYIVALDADGKTDTAVTPVFAEYVEGVDRYECLIYGWAPEQTYSVSVYGIYEEAPTQAPPQGIAIQGKASMLPGGNCEIIWEPVSGCAEYNVRLYNFDAARGVRTLLVDADIDLNPLVGSNGGALTENIYGPGYTMVGDLYKYDIIGTRTLYAEDVYDENGAFIGVSVILSNVPPGEGYVAEIRRIPGAEDYRANITGISDLGPEALITFDRVVAPNIETDAYMIIAQPDIQGSDTLFFTFEIPQELDGDGYPTGQLVADASFTVRIDGLDIGVSYTYTVFAIKAQPVPYARKIGEYSPPVAVTLGSYDPPAFSTEFMTESGIIVKEKFDEGAGKTTDYYKTNESGIDVVVTAGAGTIDVLAVCVNGREVGRQTNLNGVLPNAIRVNLSDGLNTIAVKAENAYMERREIIYYVYLKSGVPALMVDAKVDNDVVTLFGATDADAVVTVNGIETDTDDNGNFSFSSEFNHAPEISFAIKATDSFGNSVSHNETVANLTVETITGIEIALESDVMTVGDKQGLSLRAYDDNGDYVILPNSMVAWTAENTSQAPPSPANAVITGGEELSALKAGACILTASISLNSASIISDMTLVQIEPAAPDITVGMQRLGILPLDAIKKLTGAPAASSDDKGKTTQLPGGLSVYTAEDCDPVMNDDGSIALPGGGIITSPGGYVSEAPAGTIITADLTIRFPQDTGGSIRMDNEQVITVPGGTIITAADKVSFPVGSGGGTVAHASGLTFLIREDAVIIIDELAPLGYFISSSNPFEDVQTDDWYYDSVMFAYNRGLMNGTSADPMKFSPNMTTTRGMIVTILYRMDGSPDVSGLSNPFSDVAEGAWYTDAVIWAAANGIVSGYGGGLFGPRDDVTREQLSVILANYVKYKGFDLPSEEKPAFNDEAEIASWAADSVKLIQEAGIVVGKPNNMFDPKGLATRAEVATVFERLIISVYEAFAKH